MASIKQLVKALGTVLAGLTIAGTALPFIRKGYWWIRIWDFPRPQLAVTGLIASHMLRNNRALSLTALGCALYQASKIVPYTPAWRRQVMAAAGERSARSLRLLTANVLMTNRRSQPLLDLIAREQPDIVCLLEPDQWWEQQIAAIEREFPHSVKCPIDNTYGMLVYSRLPLQGKKLLFRVQDDIPSAVLDVELRSGEIVRVYCLHPRPPRPDSDSFHRDAELVLVGREIKEHPGPAVVIGDLNDVAWSYTTKLFQKISGTIDPRIGRGMYNTFHADIPLLRYSLDHVFHTPDFTVGELRRLPHIGSDHFPILVELCYAPKAAATQDSPEPEPEDLEKADEIVKDAAERPAA